MIPPHLANPPVSGLDHQALFAYLYCSQLVPWAYEQGWILIPVEMGIQLDRTTRVGGQVFSGQDAVHMKGSCHYLKTAADSNLYIRDKTGRWAWISDGGAPEWGAIGSKWKSLHPKCCWGGDFPKVDSNHLSIEYNGVK